MQDLEWRGKEIYQYSSARALSLVVRRPRDPLDGMVCVTVDG